MGKINFYTQSRIDLLESFHGILFANLQGEVHNTDTLYRFDGINWEVFDQGNSNVSLKATEEQLIVTRRYAIVLFDPSLNQTHYLSSSVFDEEKIFHEQLMFFRSIWLPVS